MALMQNTAETGLASGTAVTAGNSSTGGAGDAFAISFGATSTCVYSSAQKAHGALSHLFTVASGESAYVQWTFTSGPSASTRFYIYNSTTPTTTSLICQVRNGAQAAQVGLGSDMRLRVQNAVSADLTASWGALSNNTWYRVELVVTKGTTTSDGRIQAKVFLLDSATPISGMTLDTGTTTNTGTADMASVRFGRAGSAATAHTFYLDDYMAQDSASFLGPAGANVKPTVTPAASTVTVPVGGSATFSWTETDSDGTIASRVVTRVSGPGSAPTLTSPTTTSRQGTFPTQGVHEYQIVATDNGGAASDPASIFVVVTDTTSKPTSTVANTGGYTNVGGAGSLEAAVSDASDTTLVRSPDNPSGASIEFGHAGAPLGSGVPKIRVKLKVSAASPAITATVTLKQGTTTIATRTQIPTTTATWYEWTLTTGEASLITDRAQLRTLISASV